MKRFLLISLASLLLLSCSKSNNVDNKKGPVAVDLGLSVKWASYNIGATSPADAGSFFSWGEPSEKTSYSKDSYSSASNDIATIKWGAPWRMPTLAEVEELVNKCSWTVTVKNRVNGYEVKGPNGNTIFLPAAGWKTGDQHVNIGSDGIYWTGTLYTDDTYAYILYLGQDYQSKNWEYWPSSNVRYAGYTVRAVCP